MLGAGLDAARRAPEIERAVEYRRPGVARAQQGFVDRQGQQGATRFVHSLCCNAIVLASPRLRTVMRSCPRPNQARTLAYRRWPWRGSSRLSLVWRLDSIEFPAGGKHGSESHRRRLRANRSEEPRLIQSLMRISYAVFCLQKKKSIIKYTSVHCEQTTTHMISITN